jgi:hypothetical protein
VPSRIPGGSGCLRFLKALGFDEKSLRLILRSDGQAQAKQNWWCEKLGLTPTTKFITIKPHDSSKPESSNNWLGFQLIDVKHNETRLIVAARVMLLCSISVGINHQLAQQRLFNSSRDGDTAQPPTGSM